MNGSIWARDRGQETDRCARPPDWIRSERLILRPTCAGDRAGYIDLIASDELTNTLAALNRLAELELGPPRSQTTVSVTRFDQFGTQWLSARVL